MIAVQYHVSTKNKTRKVPELSDNNENQVRSKAHYVAIGLVFGVGIGTVLGAVFGNVGLGVAFGAAFGIIIGTVLSGLGAKGGDV